MNRRNFLAKTGMGAGVAAAGGAGLGGVTATNPSTAEDPSVVTTVEATGTHGFISIDSEVPGGGSTLPLQEGVYGEFEVSGTMQLSGEVYDDGTWKITDISFPIYKIRWDDSSSAEPVATDHSTPGTFDPESGIVTAPLTLDIELFGGSESFLEEPATFTLTSRESGDMVGGVHRPTESVLAVTLVNNEVGGVALSGNDAESAVHRGFGLGPPGWNWFELGLEMTVENPSGLEGLDIEPPAVVGDDSPTDPNGDGRFEDIRGDGEFDAVDVQALFENLDNPAVQNHAANYNFSRGSPEEVTVFDVQALFSQLG